MFLKLTTPKLPLAIGLAPVALFTLLFTGAAVAQVPALPSADPLPGQVLSSAPSEMKVPADVRPEVPVTDAERSAVAMTSLSLDLHVIPADSREEAHATLTVLNRSDRPVSRIPLQLSSTVHWISASVATPDGLKPLAFTESPIATDADHTGYAQEAVFTPAAPLAPGASLILSVVFRGEIRQSSDRLELIGAPHDKAAASDWDAILPTSDAGSTALRGFGNVLWYPVAAPTARLGDGNQLFDTIARQRRSNMAETMRLRLTVEYVGDPPDLVIFNGQMRPLTKSPDSEDLTVDETHGIATADFPAAKIGFRVPSLFLTAQNAVTSRDELVSVITPQSEVFAPYAEAVASLQPLLAGQLGPTPREPMLLLDHRGEPFEDAGFVAAQLATDADSKLVAPALVRGLAHAWWSPQSRPVPAASLWLDEGIAEYMSLLLTERNQGREAAIGELRHAALLIALAESPDTPQPLTEAYSDAFLRLKSGFVLWQLRAIVGDEVFSKSLTAFRHSIALNPEYDLESSAFQKALERISGKELGWFFDDWVYADKGLPDLTIVQANPRALPVTSGKSGYIVAVEIRNDGDAVAEVPVTVRSGTLFATERVRVPAHASGSTRIVFEGVPDTVEVNDGSVPELRSTSHSLLFQPPAPR